MWRAARGIHTEAKPTQRATEKLNTKLLLNDSAWNNNATKRRPNGK